MTRYAKDEPLLLVRCKMVSHLQDEFNRLVLRASCSRDDRRCRRVLGVDIVMHEGESSRLRGGREGIPTIHDSFVFLFLSGTSLPRRGRGLKQSGALAFLLRVLLTSHANRFIRYRWGITRRGSSRLVSSPPCFIPFDRRFV